MASPEEGNAGKLPLKAQFKQRSAQKRALEQPQQPQPQGRLITEIAHAKEVQQGDRKQVKVVESVSRNTFNPRKPRVGPEYQVGPPRSNTCALSH